MEAEARTAIAEAEFMKYKERERRLEPEKLRRLMKRLEIQAKEPISLEENFPENDVIPVVLSYSLREIKKTQSKLLLFKQFATEFKQIEEEMKPNETYEFFSSHIDKFRGRVYEERSLITENLFRNFSAVCGINGTRLEMFDNLCLLSQTNYFFYDRYPDLWKNFFAFYKRLIYFQRNARYSQLHTSIGVFIRELRSNSTMVKEENKVVIPFPFNQNINGDGQRKYFEIQITPSQRFCVEDCDFVELTLLYMSYEKNNDSDVAVTTAELYALAFIIFINMKRLEKDRIDIEGNQRKNNAFDTINRFFTGFYIFDFETGKDEREMLTPAKPSRKDAQRRIEASQWASANSRTIRQGLEDEAKGTYESQESMLSHFTRRH